MTTIFFRTRYILESFFFVFRPKKKIPRRNWKWVVLLKWSPSEYLSSEMKNIDLKFFFFFLININCTSIFFCCCSVQWCYDITRNIHKKITFLIFILFIRISKKDGKNYRVHYRNYDEGNRVSELWNIRENKMFIFIFRNSTGYAAGIF